jgi:hypothetical protein
MIEMYLSQTCFATAHLQENRGSATEESLPNPNFTMSMELLNQQQTIALSDTSLNPTSRQRQ